MEQNFEILFKSNEIIKAQYEFTTLQNKILQKAFYYIQKNSSNYAYLSLEDMKSLTKDNNLKTVENIKEVLSELMKNRIIQIKENGSWLDTYVIASHGFDKERQLFKIELTHSFMDLIVKYQKTGFTPVNVTKYLTIGNNNAQRLYELLRMWTGTKKVIEYTVKDIRGYLNLENSYAKFNDFKVRVIEKAIKELDKKELLKVEKIEYMKIGKSVESIKFYVKDLESRIYNFSENKKSKIDSDGNILLSGQIDIDDFKVEDHKEISEIDELAKEVKLSVSSLTKLSKEYGIDELIAACDILSKSKGVTARLKYLKGILEKRKNNPPKERTSKKKSNWKSGNETYSDINNSDDIEEFGKDSPTLDDVDTQEFLKSLGLVD